MQKDDIEKNSIFETAEKMDILNKEISNLQAKNEDLGAKLEEAQTRVNSVVDFLKSLLSKGTDLSTAIQTLSVWLNEDVGYVNVGYVLEFAKQLQKDLEEIRAEEADSKLKLKLEKQAQTIERLYFLLDHRLNRMPRFSNLFGFYLGPTTFAGRLSLVINSFAFLLIFITLGYMVYFAHFGALASVTTQQAFASTLQDPVILKFLELLALKSQVTFEYIRFEKMIELASNLDLETLKYMKANNLTMEDLVNLRDITKQSGERLLVEIAKFTEENKDIINPAPFWDELKNLSDSTYDKIVEHYQKD